MNKNKFFTYTILILAMVFWSFSYIWTSNVFKYLTPVTTVFIRLIIASVFLIGVSLILGKLEKIKKKDFFSFMMLAFFEPLLYYLGESYGLKLVTPTVAAIIISTIPLFLPFSMYIFAKEPVNSGTYLGITIAFAGVLLIILNKDLSFAASPLGIAFLMLAVLSVMGYSYLLQDLTKTYNAYTIISVQNFIGIFYFLPIVIGIDYSGLMSINFEIELVVNLIFLSVFASALAFFLFAQGTKKIGVTKASIFTYLIPIFTAVISYFTGHEAFNTAKVTGISIVFAGLLLSQTRIKSLFKKEK